MKESTKQFLKRYIPQSMIDGYFIMVGNRYKKMLLGIRKDQLGLEIGPSHRPIAPKKEGYQVEILDYLTKEELIEKYKSHHVNINAIEEVDYVWKGGSYSQLTGKKEYYDYILSSHSIEHSTNFIEFLRDCSSMVKNNGVISLAIPDKRQCFDHFRQVTTIGMVMDDYFQGKEYHSPGVVGEYLLNSVKRNKNLSWDKKRFQKNWSASFEFIHSYSYVSECIKDVLDKETYMDIHHYVFTDASFCLLILDLGVLGFIDLVVERCFKTVGNEFIVTLKKTKEEIRPDYKKRMKLLKKIKKYS